MSDWCLVSVRFLGGFLATNCVQVSELFIVAGWCLVGGCLYSGLVLDCFLIGVWFSWFLFSDFRLVSF